MTFSSKEKIDQMKANNLTAFDSSQSETQSKAYDESYEETGGIRNLSFVWLDGRRRFLNYSYLITVDYWPDQNQIEVSFTTHCILLTGVNLEPLYYDLMNQRCRQITCIDERYNLIGNVEDAIVNSITIEKH